MNVNITATLWLGNVSWLLDSASNTGGAWTMAPARCALPLSHMTDLAHLGCPLSISVHPSGKILASVCQYIPVYQYTRVVADHLNWCEVIRKPVHTTAFLEIPWNSVENNIITIPTFDYYNFYFWCLTWCWYDLILINSRFKIFGSVAKIGIPTQILSKNCISHENMQIN